MWAIVRALSRELFRALFCALKSSLGSFLGHKKSPYRLLFVPEKSLKSAQESSLRFIGGDFNVVPRIYITYQMHHFKTHDRVSSRGDGWWTNICKECSHIDCGDVCQYID